MAKSYWCQSRQRGAMGVTRANDLIVCGLFLLEGVLEQLPNNSVVV